MTTNLPHALGELLSWVYGDGRCKRSGVIKRAHVLLWIIRPGMFDFATEKAMAKKLGIRPQKFCEEVTAFRERFKFHSSLCQTEERRAARRKPNAKLSEGGPDGSDSTGATTALR